MARAKTFDKFASWLFSLSFSLTIDHEREQSFFELSGMIFDFFQLSAFAFNPALKLWNTPILQISLQFVLLSFQSRSEVIFSMIFVILLDSLLVMILSSSINEGAPKLSTSLKYCRNIFGIARTFLFLPVVDQLVHEVANVIHLNSWDWSNTASLVISLLGLVAGFVIPIFTITLFSAPNFFRFQALTRTSSIQNVRLNFEDLACISHRFYPVNSA
jgi:hypothetical protein